MRQCQSRVPGDCQKAFATLTKGAVFQGEETSEGMSPEVKEGPRGFPRMSSRVSHDVLFQITERRWRQMRI